MDRPRIPPLPPERQDAEVRELLEGKPGRHNLYKTLAWHPELMATWRPTVRLTIDRGKLDGRARELMILRTAIHCHAEYEWGQHVLIAREAGISDADIERIPLGPDAPGWDAADAAVLRAADELHHTSQLSDATWAALASRYDEAQLLELCFLGGQYHLVAYITNSLGVQLDPGAAPFPTPLNTELTQPIAPGDAAS